MAGSLWRKKLMERKPRQVSTKGMSSLTILFNPESPNLLTHRTMVTEGPIQGTVLERCRVLSMEYRDGDGRPCSRGSSHYQRVPISCPQHPCIWNHTSTVLNRDFHWKQSSCPESHRRRLPVLLPLPEETVHPGPSSGTSILNCPHAKLTPYWLTSGLLQSLTQGCW